MKIGQRSLIALLLSLASLAAVAPAAGRPNVVLIVVDDLGWGDLSFTGSQNYQTPNVDRLFKAGTAFTRAYASCRVCSPTRASLLTGKAPPRHGITDWIGAKSGKAWDRNTRLLPAEYVHALPAEETTLAEAMRDAGYRTFFAGKWHLGGDGSLPTDHGFDINLGGHHRGSPPGGFFSPYNNPHLPDGPPGEHLPLRLGNETASFIEANADRPFFAMLSFYSVHAPLQTTRERWEANRLEALGKPAPARRYLFDRTKAVRQTQDHPVYAGMVEAMDDAVGLVLDALDRSQQSEETIVVFTSDNGGVSSGDGFATSNLPLRGGKGRQWEGGLRVPLAISWPGRANQINLTTTRAITTDLYPTILRLCGLPLLPDQRTDGVALRLRSGPTNEQAGRPLFWHYPHYGNQGGEPSSVVLHGDWKLIRYHEDARQELYNITNDQGEQTDLAAKRPKRLAKLGRVLDDWLAETDAILPTDNPGFDAEAHAATLKRAETKELAFREERAADLLREDWQPNADWWGSNPIPKETE